MRGAPPGSAPMHYLRTHARQGSADRQDRRQTGDGGLMLIWRRKLLNFPSSSRPDVIAKSRELHDMAAISLDSCVGVTYQ